MCSGGLVVRWWGGGGQEGNITLQKACLTGTSATLQEISQPQRHCPGPSPEAMGA